MCLPMTDARVCLSRLFKTRKRQSHPIRVTTRAKRRSPKKVTPSICAQRYIHLVERKPQPAFPYP